MQHRWLAAVADITKHVLLYSIAFLFFVISAVYGSAITALASRAIESRFVFHVLVVLEYAIVLSDAALILMYLVNNIRDSFKRMIK